MQEAGLILPFFNLEEISAIRQAEISAEQKGKVRQIATPNRLIQFLGYTDWLSVKVMVHCGFAVTTSGAMKKAPRRWVRSSRAQSDAMSWDTPCRKAAESGLVLATKYFLIDTGMLSTYYAGGRASALQIQDNTKFTADYMDEQVVLEPAQKEEVAQPVAAPR